MTAVPSPLARRAASGAVWTAIEMGGSQAISLLVFSVLARFIHPRDFGLISVAYVAIFTAKTLVIDSVAFEVIRKRNATDIEYTTAFWITAALSGVLALAIYASAPLMEAALQAPGLAGVMRAMSIILVFIGLARTHEMRMARLFQFRGLALRAIAGSVAGGAIGIGMAVAGYGIAALIVQQVATSLIALVLLWLASAWRPGVAVSAASARGIGRFMASTTPTAIVGVINQNSDTLLVAFFFGPAATGLYGVAKRLRMALQTVFGTPINAVGLPALAEVQHESGRLKHVATRILAMIGLLCAPVFIGAAVIAPEIIRIAFGPQWSGAAPVFATLSVGGLVLILQNFCDGIYTLKDRQIWSFYILALYSGLAIPFFFIGRAMGADIVALPFVLPLILVFPVAAILASRLTGMTPRDWWHALGPPLISTLAMFAGLQGLGASLPFPDPVRLAAMCGAGAAIYLLMMLAIGRTALRETARALRQLARKAR